jgi:hypothetical protein
MEDGVRHIGARHSMVVTDRGSNKSFPKIILEGPRLTLKTELAFALNDHPLIAGRRTYRYSAGMISGEWSGLTREAWGESLITFSLERKQLAMQGFRSWLSVFESLPYYRWTVDRFHVSALVYQKRHHNIDLDFIWLEEGLKKLGFRIVLLTRSPDTFEHALAERLKVSLRPERYGRLQDIIDSQELYRETVGRSLLLCQEFDVSSNNVAHIATEIAQWLKMSGGFAPI